MISKNSFIKKCSGASDSGNDVVYILAALNGCGEIFHDMRGALTEVCQYLRGSSDNAWRRIKALSGRSTIDTIVFAATRADHVPRF